MPGKRDGLCTALAVAMGLLAFSNLWKPVAQHFAPESSAGFVFLGHRLHGLANAVMGPLFGALLATYAYGVWTQKRWVVPIAIAYACYVPLNLVLFGMQEQGGEEGILFLLGYTAVAVGVSAGGALHLWGKRDSLG
jgi:hypothetical protein